MSFKDYRRNELRGRIERATHGGGNFGTWLFASELDIGKELGQIELNSLLILFVISSRRLSATSWKMGPGAVRSRA